MLASRDLLSTMVAEALDDSICQPYTKGELERLCGIITKYNAGFEVAKGVEISMEDPETAEPQDPFDNRPRSATDCWHISLRFSADVLRHGMDPLSFITFLARMGHVKSTVSIMDAIPSLSAFDPESCYMGFEIDLKSDHGKKDIEDVFEFVSEDCEVHILPPKSRIEDYIALIDLLPEDSMKLGEILLRGGVLSHQEIEVALLKQKEDDRPLGDILVEEGKVEQVVVNAAMKQQVRAKTRESTTIRVDTQKLDSLINAVGELVISGANIKQHAERLRDRDLISSFSIMSRLIEDIRDSAMGVRMIPLQETFSRFNRVVRDICNDSGKTIGLEIKGGDTELDRTVIERIRDPLMHLVRNAADHGIELPEARRGKGKPERGVVSLNAYQETGDVIIEVSDDGNGLDKEHILRKAQEKGLVVQGAELSDEDIFALVFAPGFSTAKEVTNLSGRGVGMDVVKRNIEALRGTVNIESTPGVGTKVRVRLPLTLVIIDGFLVQVGHEYFVVPMDAVVECLELTAHARKAAHGRQQINLRGEILPYISLHDMFDDKYDGVTKHEHILVVRYGEQRVGLLVDTLHGEVQTVVKTLGHVYKDIRCISGATIMGDGTVALILDVKDIAGVALEEINKLHSTGDAI
jgi:two-component system chemotaxis sensor kinase CheA